MNTEQYDKMVKLMGQAVDPDILDERTLATILKQLDAMNEDANEPCEDAPCCGCC